MKPVKVAVADDHPLHLEGLVMLLKNSGRVEISGTAADGEAVLALVQRVKPDVLLLDLHLPKKTGLEVAEALFKAGNPVKTIILTMQRGGRFVHRFQKFGVQGYLLKNTSVENLLEAIHTVHNGGTCFDEEAEEYDHEEQIRMKSSIHIDEQPAGQLSEREKEILVLVCKEYSSAEIAKKLFISVGTVDTHRKNILLKLGVTNTVGLVKYAIRHGLLEE
ncbi:MAG: two component transcriptional regulator, LuxR family [Bacteroidetes bacterium]|nr:MAG: two component transcriptional regulator, LuxR family [Bacteroidota bacterium]